MAGKRTNVEQMTTGPTNNGFTKAYGTAHDSEDDVSNYGDRDDHDHDHDYVDDDNDVEGEWLLRGSDHLPLLRLRLPHPPPLHLGLRQGYPPPPHEPHDPHDHDYNNNHHIHHNH